MEYLGITFKWELTEKEKTFIKYLVDNGFNIISNKQYLSKLSLVIEKDGITTDYDITNEVTDIEGYISIFNKTWEMTKAIEQHKSNN